MAGVGRSGAPHLWWTVLVVVTRGSLVRREQPALKEGVNAVATYAWISLACRRRRSAHQQLFKNQPLPCRHDVRHPHGEVVSGLGALKEHLRKDVGVPNLHLADGIHSAPEGEPTGKDASCRRCCREANRGRSIEGD
jgi:hypothetical protein